jgi:ribosomal protein S18 acetylase RimI-like enzyme
MTTPTATIARKAIWDDLPSLSRTLASAFQEDPVLSWCYPDADRRRRILPRFFAVIAEAALGADHVYTTADTAADLVGGAIWIPPGVEDDGDELAAELAEASGEYAPRLLELLELLDASHPYDQHHYLFVLGTRPEWQSRGIGSSLMRPVLEICDRDRVPAYLEATSERNVPLYLRHGFEVTREIRLSNGPSYWCMWREPGATPGSHEGDDRVGLVEGEVDAG